MIYSIIFPFIMSDVSGYFACLAFLRFPCRFYFPSPISQCPPLASPTLFKMPSSRSFRMFFSLCFPTNRLFAVIREWKFGDCHVWHPIFGEANDSESRVLGMCCRDFASCGKYVSSWRLFGRRMERKDCFSITKRCR